MGNEVTSMSSDLLSIDRGSGLAGLVAHQADNGGLLGAHGLDVVWEVVCVGAGEGLAARKWLLGGLGIHDLDVGIVTGVDNCADVEEGVVAPGVPGNLAEHAGDIGGAGLNGVPVANPGLGEGLVVDSVGTNGQGWDLSMTGGRGEVDRAGLAVLLDELDDVGCAGSGGEEGHSGNDESA